MAHQASIVLGQFLDSRERRPTCERIAGEGGAVAQVELLGIGALRIKTGADWYQAAAQRLGQGKDIRCDAFGLAGEQAPGSAKPGLHLVDYQQRAVAVTQLQSGRQVTR